MAERAVVAPAIAGSAGRLLIVIRRRAGIRRRCPEGHAGWNLVTRMPDSISRVCWARQGRPFRNVRALRRGCACCALRTRPRRPGSAKRRGVRVPGTADLLVTEDRRMRPHLGIKYHPGLRSAARIGVARYPGGGSGDQLRGSTSRRPSRTVHRQRSSAALAGGMAAASRSMPRGGIQVRAFFEALFGPCLRHAANAGDGLFVRCQQSNEFQLLIVSPRGPPGPFTASLVHSASGRQDMPVSLNRIESAPLQPGGTRWVRQPGAEPIRT